MRLLKLCAIAMTFAVALAGAAHTRNLEKKKITVQILDQIPQLDALHLLHHRIVPPDLALHRLRRAAAMKRDDRVPAALVGGGQVLDQARDLKPLLGGSESTAQASTIDYEANKRTNDSFIYRRNTAIINRPMKLSRPPPGSRITSPVRKL